MGRKDSAGRGRRSYDASLGRGFAKHWSVLFKYADYQADDFARDTQKVWIQVEYVL